MEQKILFNADAREKLIAGINKLGNVVESTLGPSGHGVVLDLEPGNPFSTKDGVTVAKAINLEDPLENAGAQMLKQASVKTAEEAGDGTTTATLLARSLCVSGMSKQNQEINGVDYRKGMNSAVKDVIDYLKTKVSKPITTPEKLKQVATISANGDEEVGQLVSKAISTVGQDGAVAIEESKTGESYLDIVEGIQFDRGYKSPYFVTDEGEMQTVLSDVVLLIVDKRLSSIKELVPALNAIIASEKSLLIIAEDIDAEVLSTLVLNKVRAGFKVCAVKAPEFGDRRKDALQDIAVLTGGTVVSPDKGMKLESFDPSWLGEASKVTVTRDKTTIIGAKGEQSEIDKRAEDIKKLVENAQSAYDKEQLQTRFARFIGGIAVIYVGGHTELELRERKDRVDDSLHAATAASEEGICPGGGKALLAASQALLTTKKELKSTPANSKTEAFDSGYRAVLNACQKPFYTIQSNAGGVQDYSEIKKTVTTVPDWTSLNVETRCWEDMDQAGIVDPTKVIRLALKNAVSVAGTILTSEALVVNLPEKKENVANG